MRRFAAVPVLCALLLAACAPAAGPTSKPAEPGSPAVNQGYVESHRRMGAALQRFVTENPVVAKSVGDVSRLRGDDVRLVDTISVTRVIRFVHGTRVVYGVWVTDGDATSIALSAPGDAPLNYPQNYFARMDALYGAKPMDAKERSAFAKQFTEYWDEGNYDTRDLRAAQTGSATVVEVQDVYYLVPAEDAPISLDIDWTYDPVADRVLSITLGDEMEY